MANVELVIKMPDELYETIKFDKCGTYQGRIYDIIKNGTPLKEQSRWIPTSKGLPKVDEEGYSNDILLSLRKTIWDIDKCQMVHITKIAYYNENAISSDGKYMDTEGWVLKDGSALSMDEGIAWMPLPKPYKRES